MANHKSKTKTSNSSVKSADFNYMLFPVFAYIFIPIILRVYIIKDKLIQFQWYGTEGHSVDEYFWGKCIAMYIIVGIMALMVLFASMNNLLDFNRFDFPKEKRKLFTRWYSLIIISFVFAFISSLFSKYISFSFGYGTSENRQTVWTLLCYTFIVLYAFLVIANEKDLKLLQWPLLLMEAIVFVIGYVQHKGGVVEKLPIISTFLVPSKYSNMIDSNISAATEVSSTFGNPNYLGVFVALCIPLSVLLVFANKNYFIKLLWLLDAVGLLVLDIWGHNKTSIFSLVAAFGVLLIILFWQRKSFVGFIIILVGILSLCTLANYFQPKLAGVISNLKGTNRSLILDELSFEADGVHLSYEGVPAVFGYDVIDGELIPWIKDGNGNLIETYQNEEGYTVSNVDGYQMYFLHYYIFDSETYPDSEAPYAVGLKTTIPGLDEILFVYHAIDQTYYYVTQSLKLATDNKPTPFVLFDDHLDIISSRGLIWGKTIPILPRYLILGTGADCFAMGYPNNDYAFRIRLGYGETNYVETKAHSFYLQTWVQQGGLSLFCLLGVFGIYIIDALKIYTKKCDNKFLYYFGLGLLLSVISYLVMGITNDSKVGPATLFWLLLGIGFAVNRLVKLEQESN